MKIITYDQVYNEFEEVILWMKVIGVKITAGRTNNYRKLIKYWAEEYSRATPEEGKRIFVDFVSYVYEIFDFIDIYRALRDEDPEDLIDIRKKLQRGVNGPLNMAEEKNSNFSTRNYIFEALTSARFHRKSNGINCDLNSVSDSGFNFTNKKLLVECKRLNSHKKLEANIKDAIDQLETNLFEIHKLNSRGVIALDFTKLLHVGDKILVKNNDKELLEHIPEISNSFIYENQHIWEKVFQGKTKKIIGIIIRYSTMASSKEQNRINGISQWTIIPRSNIRFSDYQLLSEISKVTNNT